MASRVDNNATVIDVGSVPSTTLDQGHETENNAPTLTGNLHGQSPKVDEYRNMIRHILSKLHKRKRPPTALTLLAEQCSSIHVSTDFDNDDCIDLLVQLRTALIFGLKGGFTIDILTHGERGASPMQSYPNSPLASPLSFSQPPKHSDEPATQTTFERILTTLNDLVLNDSRFKTANPKPTKPSYALQSLLVDNALVLAELCFTTAQLCSLATIMLPAFDSFPEGSLQAKLLSFYIDTLIPKLKNAKPTASSARASFSFSQDPAPRPNEAPAINIQTPDQDSDTQQRDGLTINTHLSVASSPRSPRSPRSPTSPRTSAAANHDILQTRALFSPLLYFMIQYLDPYLSSNVDIPEGLSYTIARKAHSIYSFHRGLKYIIQEKPDIYLDLLDVISYGSPETKFRACQILFTYYHVSTGHVVVAEALPTLGYLEEFEALDRARHDQEFEQERQHRQRQQTDPTFLETMMGSNPPVNNNRRYRNSGQVQRINSEDSTDEDTVDVDQHVWYPHLFPDQNHNQADELVIQVQRLSTGVQAFNAVVHDDMNGAYCKECFKILKGYGLRCYHCKCSVHYTCMANNDLDIMLYVKQGGIQKVVSPQFCHVVRHDRFDVESNPGLRMAHFPPYLSLRGHEFSLVNLYTLMLCASCRLPLWGICQQGYRCTTCNRFVHPECLAAAEREHGFNHALSTIQDCQPYKPLLEVDTKIELAALCRELAAFYGDLISLDVNDLKERTYEEVSTMLNVLLIQERILHCGISAGCLLIDTDTDDPLHTSQPSSTSSSGSARSPTPSICPYIQQAIDACSQVLQDHHIQQSPVLAEFYRTREPSGDDYLLSKEEYLSHMAGLMKALSTTYDTPSGNVQQSSDTRGFLRVESAPMRDLDDGDDIPNESLDKGTCLAWLKSHLRLRSHTVAEIILQQMRNIGLLERENASPILTRADPDTPCVFVVPYAIDATPAVESLINAIDSCLNDINITLNECGMLLLVRRCWPDPFMSRYTTERLFYCIFNWIFLEDEKLSQLHAEYTANRSQLPGVKQNRWAQAAQAALLSRFKGSGHDRSRQSITFANAAGMSSGAGSVYVTTRGALRDRYIIRWMATMHEIDPTAYANILFDTITRIVEGKREECVFGDWIEPQDQKRATIQRFEEIVGYILKVKSYGLAFTALDTILQRCFDKAFDEFQEHGLLNAKEPADIRNLHKLCSTKTTVPKTSTTSTAVDPAHAFDVITALFAEGDCDSLNRGVRWLSLVMHAGTGVPSNSLAKLARLLVEAQASIRITAEFLKLVWFQTVNILNVTTSRAIIIDVIGYLNETALDSLRAKNDIQDLSPERLASAQMLIRYSAALACFAYNCPLSNITELDIVPYFGDHVAQLSHNKRSSLHSDNAASLQVDENTPIIRSMLIYLELDQLNMRAPVLKMFYALVHWGFGINNKSDFVEKCMPSLISAIWEMLPPSNDDMSDISLSLLMKLMSTDVQYFHSCVFKIFESENWEVRYQGLDNLYGLFTKMDVAFQTKWLPMLSHLGPVFSYFVGCLWDKEEYVRTKAFALIRSFGTLHLRSAFRCWEAYFLTASDGQRMAVLKLMIQLSALFPAWQVIQWESLLEPIESKQHESAETYSVDILEELTRDHPKATDERSPAEIAHALEIENVRVLMITLAMQMLSNHLSVDSIQISRLKYALVHLMGFQDCSRFNSSGEWVVTFGNLAYDPRDPAQNSVMMACSRSLKKVMDSFAPLPAETVASMASDVLERNRLELAENSSPGVHFIDVVLQLFNFNVDVSRMSHMVLRTWLEVVLVMVYKHNILEREYEHSIVNCMKQIIELLTKEISEENKLLILEILKCLLRRSDHLTAMVLSKQIMALGKLMTKLGSRMSEPVFLKAKEFLKSAFLRFAVAGLFVLMFKNQTVSDVNNHEVDLFFVLRIVIDPEDLVPDEDMQEVIYLRDQPVRDVLDKLMKQQMEKHAFSTVLFNMCRYVETVHSHPYAEGILSDFALFLNGLCKHTANWRRSEWDINPVFTMAAILMKEHPYHFSILLPQIQVLLKYGLQHCTIQPESIVKLLASFASLKHIPGIPSENVFVESVIEEVKIGLTSRQRLHKDTLLVLLQLLFWDSRSEYAEWFNATEKTLPGDNLYGHSFARYFEHKHLSLIDPLVYYLKTPPLSQQYTKKDFKTCQTVAELLVTMCLENEHHLSRILGLQKLDEPRHCLRFLSWFLLSALRENRSNLCHPLLAWGDVVTDILLQTFNTLPIDFENPDVSFSYSASGESLLHAFLILKAWTLTTKSENKLPPSFWMSLWPALRRLLTRIQPSTLIVPGNVGLSVWNLFLSLLQFLFCCRSPIVLVNAYEWMSSLDSLLDQVASTFSDIQDTSDATQAASMEQFQEEIMNIRRMFTVPPVEVPQTILIDQLLLELRDIMRLQAESVMFQANTRTYTTPTIYPGV